MSQISDRETKRADSPRESIVIKGAAHHPKGDFRAKKLFLEERKRSIHS